MEWLDAKNCPPNMPGKILVKIGKNYFIANVYLKESGTIILNFPEEIFYELSKISTLHDITYSNGARGWVLPTHFKFPEKYCYIDNEEVKIPDNQNLTFPPLSLDS